MRLFVTALAVLLLLVPALPVEAILPEPAGTVEQAYCTLLLNAMVNGETAKQCIDSLTAEGSTESASGGCDPEVFMRVDDSGDRAVVFTPLLAINSPWDGEGIRVMEKGETVEHGVGFEFGPVEVGIDSSRTDMATEKLEAINGQTKVKYQEIEWGRYTLYVWQKADAGFECNSYDFWRPTEYKPSGAILTREWYLSVGTAAFTDADNAILPTADPEYVSWGSPPVMSLDIRYKTREGDDCPTTGSGFSIGTKNTWRGEVGFDFGGEAQVAVGWGHSESDNWAYTFNDDGNCYYYDFLGTDGEARAGVAFHTFKSPDFPLCSPDGSDCCEGGAWDMGEGKCCDPDDLSDFDCQDIVSEHCSPHIAATCESLEETLTEAAALLAVGMSCAELQARYDTVEGTVPIAAPDSCPGMGGLPWVAVCGVHFGDPDGEPLVFNEPIVCNRPSPCAMLDHPDPCQRPDPCEAPVLESKVECGLPGPCDVEGVEGCVVKVPSRAIPAVVVCEEVVFSGRGDGAGALIIDNEAVCGPDTE